MALQVPSCFAVSISDSRPESAKALNTAEDCCINVCMAVQRRGLSLNPVTTMYYIAPASFAFLSIPWFFIECRPLLADTTVRAPWTLAFSNFHLKKRGSGCHIPLWQVCTYFKGGNVFDPIHAKAKKAKKILHDA